MARIPYTLMLVLLFGGWYWLFHQVGNLLLRYRSDWANLATSGNPEETRRIALILDAKHLVFVSLLLGCVFWLLHVYPEHRSLTLGVGVLWAVFIFPWGVLALGVILILWLM